RLVHGQLTLQSWQLKQAPCHVIAAVAISVLGRCDRYERVDPAFEVQTIATRHEDWLDLLILRLKPRWETEEEVGRTGAPASPPMTCSSPITAARLRRSCWARPRPRPPS